MPPLLEPLQVSIHVVEVRTRSITQQRTIRYHPWLKPWQIPREAPQRQLTTARWYTKTWEMGGVGFNSDACAHQIPPLHVNLRIPGQEKLQGDSQLDFQNYTPVPEIAGELARVGSHRRRADANFSASVRLICMHPLCFAVEWLPSSAENHDRVTLRYPIHSFIHSFKQFTVWMNEQFVKRWSELKLKNDLHSQLIYIPWYKLVGFFDLQSVVMAMLYKISGSCSFWIKLNSR